MAHTLNTKQVLALSCATSAICCVSLVFAASLFPEFLISYHSSGLLWAAVGSFAFAIVGCLFALASFSFGYLIGFYLYVMILGYLWLSSFSPLPYNHALTALSAGVSGIAFLLPALFIHRPLQQPHRLSIGNVELILTLILLIAIATIGIGARYNFRIVGIDEIYTFRDALALPTALNYVIGITTSSLLPFAFACFVLRGNFWRAGLAAILMLAFYPITLAKMSLFAPAWLIGLAIVSRIIDCRTTTILSLLVPLSAGVMLFIFHSIGPMPFHAGVSYFGLVNFRMVAIPSLAMDYYNYFFSTHELTHFCQVRPLKVFLECPYEQQLSVVINKFFAVGGNFNASLFATEGIASVGPLFAPLTVLACGLVIAFVNRLSSGLPDRFILLSGAVLAQVFLNVPFTTILLTHGAVVLFLLWYLLPREFFKPNFMDNGQQAQPSTSDVHFTGSAG